MTVASYTLLLAAQVLLVSWTPQGYEEAYTKSMESGKPFLILVGADWCGACQIMKKRVMPDLHREGVFNDLYCTEVDLDKDSHLKKQIARVRTIPCLILYTKTGDKWHRSYLTGMQNGKSIQAFLDKHAANSIASRSNKKSSK